MVAMDADGTAALERNSDELFPAASVIKVPLVMALYAEAAHGRLSLDETISVGQAVPGSGVLRLVHGISSLSLRDLAMLSIAVSDNTATNALIDRVGLAAVADHLAAWGIERTCLARKMYDLEAQACGRENLMTPRETASLLLRLLHGECVDRATSDAVLALLLECTHDSLLARYLPAGARVAHKSGWIEGVRNDAGIVWAERAVIVVGFSRSLPTADEARSLLGLLGWCAYRRAGGGVEPLPSELARRA